MNEANVHIHDPVCHMDLSISDAVARSDHRGKTYHFCSETCKEQFDADPDSMLQIEQDYDHESGRSRMSA